MKRKEVLDAAAKCVLSDRNHDYGDPEDNFRVTAAIMSAYLRGRGILSEDLQPHDVAALMVGLKLARLCTSPAKADNWVDMVGYAACGAECAEKVGRGPDIAFPFRPADVTVTATGMAPGPLVRAVSGDAVTVSAEEAARILGRKVSMQYAAPSPPHPLAGDPIETQTFGPTAEEIMAQAAWKGVGAELDRLVPRE